MADTPPIDTLIDFPSIFVFRAVGDASTDFSDRCIAAVREALGREHSSVDTRSSRGDRFLSVRVGAWVLDLAEIHAAYAALRAVEGVRIVL